MLALSYSQFQFSFRIRVSSFDFYEPPKALAPYRVPWGPLKTSICSTSSMLAIVPAPLKSTSSTRNPTDDLPGSQTDCVRPHRVFGKNGPDCCQKQSLDLELNSRRPQVRRFTLLLLLLRTGQKHLKLYRSLVFL